MSTSVANKVNFLEKALNSEKVVLVDFYADWCGPCKMLSHTINELEREYADKSHIYRVNIDENPELAEQFGIVSIPTIIAFKNGTIIAREVGLKPKKTYEDILNR